MNLTVIKAKQTLNILKALTSTKWGKQNELIISTFKAIICPHCNVQTPYGAQSYQNQYQETANHSEHSFAYCYGLHMRHKHSTPTKQNQCPTNGHPFQTSCYSS